MNTKWTDLPELPTFFDRYIRKVDDLPLSKAFESHKPTDIMADMEKLIALEDKVYAPSKWTIKDILQHIIDTERILSYRALRFARNDKTILPGFDEALFAQNTQVNTRSIEELMQEWKVVRAASISMFNSFDNIMLQRSGEVFNSLLSVLGLGFVILGHSIHHYEVIESRYFPLIVV